MLKERICYLIVIEKIDFSTGLFNIQAILENMYSEEYTLDQIETAINFIISNRELIINNEEIKIKQIPEDYEIS